MNNVGFRKVIVWHGSFSVSSPDEIQTQVTQEYYQIPNGQVNQNQFLAYLFQGTFASQGVCASVASSYEEDESLNQSELMF